MTPIKKQKRKTRTCRRAQEAKKRVDKRGLDQIEAEAREFGYKFKSSPPLAGKAKQ